MESPRPDASAVDTLLRAWTDAFNASDLAAIVALYDDGALLWGTTATSLIDSREGVEAYFSAVFAQQPPPRVEIMSAVARSHAETAVAGSYVLVLTVAGSTLHLPARYSFHLRRHGAHWRIAVHHSSLLPATP